MESLLNLINISGKRSLKGESKIIIGSALFAFIPVGVMLANNCSVYNLLFGRLLVAAVVLFMISGNKKSLIKLSLKELVHLVIWALIMLGAMVCYFSAIKYSNISVSSALLGTQPLIIALMASIVLREKISALNVFAIFLSIAGIVLIIGFKNMAGNGFLYGQILALLSAFLLSTIFIFQKKYLSRFDEKSLVFYQSFFQLPFLLLFIDYSFKPVNFSFISAIFLLGIVCSVMSYTLIFSGTKTVAAQKIGTLQSIEYVLPVFIGIVCYNERPQSAALLGMLMVIVACLMVNQNKPLSV